jgi:beta-galactosidase
VNMKNSPVTVTFEGTKTGVLSGRTYSGNLELPAFGAELLQ